MTFPAYGRHVITTANSYDVYNFSTVLLPFFLSFLLFPVAQRKSVSSNDSFTSDVEDETGVYTPRVCREREKRL